MLHSSQRIVAGKLFWDFVILLGNPINTSIHNKGAISVTKPKAKSKSSPKAKLNVIPKKVTFNSVEAEPSWPEMNPDMAKAQATPTVLIGGKEYQRIRWNEAHRCHDCGAIKGQYHAIMCCVERCPCCGHQLINCDCNYDDWD